jgi:hypothetical protein
MTLFPRRTQASHSPHRTVLWLRIQKAYPRYSAWFERTRKTEPQYHEFWTQVFEPLREEIAQTPGFSQEDLIQQYRSYQTLKRRRTCLAGWVSLAALALLALGLLATHVVTVRRPTEYSGTPPATTPHVPNSSSGGTHAAPFSHNSAPPR